MKILLISLNALGDTYLSATAIKCIKSRFPYSEIHIITSESIAKHFSNIGFKKYFIIEKTVKSIFYKIILIRKEKYNYAFSFFPGRLNSLLLFFSNAKIKAGYLNFNKLEQWFDKSQKVYCNKKISNITRWMPTMDYIERIRIVLQSVKIDANNLSKRIIEIDSNQKFIGQKKVVMHLFSKERERALPARLIAVLTKFISNYGLYEIELVGRKSEFDATCVKYCEDNSIKIKSDLAFNELINILQTASLFIGVDSYPLHVADGHGITLIGLFSHTYPNSVLLNSKSFINFNVVSFEKLKDAEFNKILIENESLFAILKQEQD